MNENQIYSLDCTCVIWTTDAKMVPRTGDYSRINSHRAGGAYKISGSNEVIIKNKSNLEKAKLTTWLLKQHEQGIEEPEITEEIIKNINEREQITVSRKIENFFRFIQRQNPKISFRGAIADSGDLLKYSYFFLALIEAHELVITELIAFLELLTKMEYIKINDYRTEFEIEPKGWDYLEKISTKRNISNNAFVAMWFDDSLNNVYNSQFEKALETCGYSSPFRIDQHHHTGKVDDEIIAKIRQSSLIVVDLTCRVNERPPEIEGNGKIIEARGGVYFEAGLAWGLEIPIIWTCRKDCVDAIHFDTRQYPQILWYEENEQFYVDDLNGRKTLHDALVNRINAIKKIGNRDSN